MHTLKILLAIEGSPHSGAAIAQVATRPWPKGATVKLLTVIHPDIPLFIEPTLVVAAAHVEQAEGLRHHAPEIVAAAAEEISRGAPEVEVTTKILEGSPHNLIVEEARDWDADLIVLGSHGHGRLRRIVLGSVAGAVVANARVQFRSFVRTTFCTALNPLRDPARTRRMISCRSPRASLFHGPSSFSSDRAPVSLERAGQRPCAETAGGGARRPDQRWRIIAANVTAHAARAK